MALLPLSLARPQGEAGAMSKTVSQQAGVIRRLVNGIGRIVAECNDATIRISTLAGTPERFPVDPDRAPDTYAEFLIRAAGAARRVPARSARRG
jgi:hypothetical protein